MKVSQFLWNKGSWYDETSVQNYDQQSQLLLVFGERFALEKADWYDSIRAKFPAAFIVSASTAGEIAKWEVNDNSIHATGVLFEKTKIKAVSGNITAFSNSAEAGSSLAKELMADDLCYLMVISDGNLVNGTELVEGINTATEMKIPITGGLSGDGDRFAKTVVGLDTPPVEGTVCLIGFYGDQLEVGHGSMGGWDVFGPEKTVNKSNQNVVIEIENQSALELYKQYLGKYASGLPGAALLFPLALKINGSDNYIVRTILKIDEASGAMTFAGNIPEGSQVRFMRANFDRLIDAATTAAQETFANKLNQKPDLAILVSCVGRKLVLGQRVDEEVEAVSDTFGRETPVTGFYSYGEISPLKGSGKCELHNQTMTITTLTEK